MLYLRILSALFGIPIVLGSVYLGGYWYALFLAIVTNVGAYEYNQLLKKRGYRIPAIVTYLGVTLFIAAIYFEQQVLLYPLLMFLFIMLFTSTLFKMDRLSVVESAVSIWGIIYIGGMFGFILLLRMQPEGAIYTYILLAGVWIHDTLAYFVGVKWGLRKFAPQISPNKSLEGSMAGLFGTAAIFFSVTILLPDLVPVNPGAAIVLAIGLSVFAQLGDLLESALKRQLQVKDSGGLIPGHGGVLDRFDSLMLAAPFVYYFFMLKALL
jgi:phosphatidate cytidylyltransferase